MKIRNILVFSCVALLIGCNQHSEFDNSITIIDGEQFFLRDGLLFDNAVDDVFEIPNWSEERRRAFEKRNGYKSFATKSEEIYDLIDLDNFFETLDELLRFVDANNFYLEIVEDTNGELQLLPRFNRDYKRFYLDENLQEIGIFRNFYNELSSIPFYDRSSSIFDYYEENSRIRAYNSCYRFANSLCDQRLSRRWGPQNTSGNRRSVAYADFSRRNTNAINWSFQVKNQTKRLGIWINEAFHTSTAFLKSYGFANGAYTKT